MSGFVPEMDPRPRQRKARQPLPSIVNNTVVNTIKTNIRNTSVNTNVNNNPTSVRIINTAGGPAQPQRLPERTPTPVSSSGSSDAGVIMAGSVAFAGILAVSAVVSIVGAIVAAVMAMVSTIIIVVGAVAGVAVLGMALPPIIRAIGDAKAAQLGALGSTAPRSIQTPGTLSSTELEDLRARLQMLELRTAPVNRELER